jgi:hypothetical protein
MPNLTQQGHLTGLGRWAFAGLSFLVVILLAAALFGPREGPTADIGETVNVARGTQSNGTEGFWPCGSTMAALDEMVNWAVRGDSAEVKRVMARTQSIALTSGLRVKILDTGFGKRKVRVLGNYADGPRYAQEDPRTGVECWVATEALSR